MPLLCSYYFYPILFVLLPRLSLPSSRFVPSLPLDILPFSVSSFPHFFSPFPPSLSIYRSRLPFAFTFPFIAHSLALIAIRTFSLSFSSSAVSFFSHLSSPYRPLFLYILVPHPLESYFLPAVSFSTLSPLSSFQTFRP